MRPNAAAQGTGVQASPEQLFEEEFTDHIRDETYREQWQLGAVGASVATLGSLAAAPAALPAALVAGGAYGVWWARSRGQREKTLDTDAEPDGSRKGPTMRRLRFLAAWGHRQLLESVGALPEWRAIILDELVSPFSPWVQQLYLIRARTGGRIEDDADSHNVFQHLLPLYCVLQQPSAVDATREAAAVLSAAVEAEAFDATCAERVRAIFPTILEVISAVDRLPQALHEDAMRQLASYSEVAFSLAPREERQPRLQLIVGELRRIMDRPDVRRAQSGPASSQHLALHSMGKAVVGAPVRRPQQGQEQEQEQAQAGVEDEFFSCSEDEGSPPKKRGGAPHAAGAASSCPFGGGNAAQGACPVFQGPAKGSGPGGRARSSSSSGPAEAPLETNMDAKAKMEAMWERLLAAPCRETRYPEAAAMMNDVQTRDYSNLLELEEDFYPQGTEKIICSAGGVVAPVHMEWLPHTRERFTGMFRKADCGVMRCSTVIEPSAPSRWSVYPALVPMVALKFFRDGPAPSANLVLAHKKSGHKNPNFFGHAVSNHFTENIVYPFTALLKVFYKYSDFPTFAGIAPFAAMGEDGRKEDKTVCPYALVLHAPEALRRKSVSVASKHLINQFRGLKAGDVVYQVYAVPEPIALSKAGRRPKGIWHVGNLRLEAPFIASELGDQKLFFQHHLFEGDLKLRPDWKAKADKMLGAPVYEEIIEEGDLWDGSGSAPS